MITEENINNFLIQQDIEGLIALGSPHDEYSSEAEAIYKETSLLDKEQRTVSNIITIIAEVWEKYFGIVSVQDKLNRQSAFEKLAHYIAG